MGSAELQVVLDQLGATARRWQGLSGKLRGVGASPSPGQHFQATTAAVSGIHAAIGGAASIFAGRIDATAAGVTSAAAGYAQQEAANAGAMAAVTPVTVV